MTAAPRTTPARLAQLEVGLTDRQRELLESVAKLRLLSTIQLQRLHFTSGTPLSAARSCRRNLADLAKQGLLARLDRQIGGVRAGSSGYLWSLGSAGQHLLERRGPAGGTQRRHPWTPALPFLAHRLAISELYVELVEGSRAGRGELLRFDSEPDSWRHFTGPGGGAMVLRPDAFGVIALGNFEDSWLIEADLGTESPMALQRKCRNYITYWRSGREQASREVFPLVVFVVPHADRATVVLRVLSGLTDAERRLFRTVTRADAARSLLEAKL